MLNLAAVSGICAITESGMCPFNFSNLNELGGIGAEETAGAGVAGEGAPVGNIFAQVPSPTRPSAVKPLADCQPLTAFSVPGPKEPSAPRPKNDWSFFTSSPLDPTFSNIGLVFVFIYPGGPKKFNLFRIF